MAFLIRQTLIYAVPLMIVALAGVFAERSGIINLALEGMMIFGAYIGVVCMNVMMGLGWFDAVKSSGNPWTAQWFLIIAMLVSSLAGSLFSLLLAFAAINLKADQTIGGTALNMLAPAIVLFLVRITAKQNSLLLASGDSATWFMLKKSTWGFDKSYKLSVLGDAFLNKVYLTTYLCIVLFSVSTSFGCVTRAS